MKKLSLFLIVFMLVVSGVYADKTITFSEIKKYGGTIFFNQPSRNTMVKPVYYPFAIQMWAKSVANDGTMASASKTRLFGNPSNTTYTKNEIYQMAPAFIKPLMRDVWLELLNEDLDL